MRALIFLLLNVLFLSGFDISDPIQKQNGVEYAITGGGETALDPRWKEFPLKIIMTKGKRKKEQYTPYQVRHLRVFSTDQKKLLEVKDAGPWLLLRLPPGDYYVYSHDERGIAKNITVRVAKKTGEQNVFYLEFPE